MTPIHACSHQHFPDASPSDQILRRICWRLLTPRSVSQNTQAPDVVPGSIAGADLRLSTESSNMAEASEAVNPVSQLPQSTSSAKVSLTPDIGHRVALSRTLTICPRYLLLPCSFVFRMPYHHTGGAGGRPRPPIRARHQAHRAGRGEDSRGG